MSLSTSIASFVNLLGHPFHEEENRKNSIFNFFLISLFVAGFLYTVRPFNMDYTGEDALLFSLIFGLITFTTILIYDFSTRIILGDRIKGESFTLGKWILITMGLILTIGICNYLFLYFSYDRPIRYLWGMIYSTFLIGIFPLVFIGTISMVARERKNETIAEELNILSIAKATDKEVLKIWGIDSACILYIESLQNYVRIWYIDNEELQNKMERATMKSIEQLVLSSTLIRCHRSYIVNKSKVVDVKGNAQGLKLYLEHTTFVIPVSRSFIPAFKA